MGITSRLRKEASFASKVAGAYAGLPSPKKTLSGAVRGDKSDIATLGVAAASTIGVGAALSKIRRPAQAAATITPIASRMSMAARVKTNVMQGIRAATDAPAAPSPRFMAASRKARGVLDEVGGSDSLRRGQYNSLTGYLQEKGKLAPALERAASVEHRLKARDRMRRPLPKKGEEGWIRMTRGVYDKEADGHHDLIRMGPGKFPGEENLSQSGIFGTGASKAPHVRMQVKPNRAGGEVYVDYLRRIGPVHLKDVENEMTAVQRSFKARGMDKVMYTPVSGSRTRLFEGMLKKRGIPSTPLGELKDDNEISKRFRPRPTKTKKN